MLEAEQAVHLTASAIHKAKQLVIDQQLKQTVGGGNFTDLERALTRWAEWRFKHFESIHAQNVALASLSRTVGVSLQDPAGATAPPP